MNRKLLISIILPAHNEEEILAKTLSDLLQKLPEITSSFEIIIVENGSNDKTLKIAQNFAQKFPKIKIKKLTKPSYGKAIKRGIETASGKKIFCFNVDFYDLKFLSRAVKLLDKFDIIIGSKNLKGTRDQRSLLRKLITKSFNFLIKVLFHFKGTDTHGLKAFRKNKILPFLPLCKTEREIFDTELILRSIRGGLTIQEIPVSVEEKRPTRTPLILRIMPTLIDLFKLFGLWF